MYHTPSCNHVACTNYRSLRKNAGFDKDVTENVLKKFFEKWHRHIPLVNISYNTTYQTSIGCELSQLFHGQKPHNTLDHKVGLKYKIGLVSTTDFANKLLKRTQVLYDKAKKTVMLSNIKYKKFCDKKLKTSPLQEKRLLLHIAAKSGSPQIKITISRF